MSTSSLTDSSSFCYVFTYDVFISFRGTDTRYGFTNNLYQALHRKGIHTFFDDEELRNGEEITPTLLKAIEGSRIAIVVFSKNYASSSFCLDELAKIMECVKGNGRWVFPVFYDVDPSDVRHQKGSYREALTKHEERFKDDKDKVHKWRSALRQAANLSGSDFKLEREYEHAFIEKIVKEISNRISRVPLNVADYPVGLESRVPEVNKLLNGGSKSGAHMVGIYGVGGIGKTTLAKAVYNLIADQFEGLCFLENVRENSIRHGLAYLQELFLSKTLGEKDIKLASESEGISLIKQRFKSKKILLVLDDVDKLEQLQAIAGRPDWFGSGSIIIITTRDNHLLGSLMVEKSYQVKEFDDKEALELLRWNAFKHENVDPSYMDILNEVVSYASGIPLVLVVIGSNLYGRSAEQWISAIEEYKKIPNKDIQKILKVSFDALGEYHRIIFLDIACCFKGYSLAELENILHAHHDVSPKFAIHVLIERSLIKIDDFGYVTQHDLIQDMGREVFRQQSPNNPGKRSRLWIPEEVMQVLQQNIGTNNIELIFLEAPMSKVIEWDGEAFRKMKNLRTLIIKSGNFFNGPNHLPDSLRVLEWRGYPSHSLPVDFHPKKLSILKLPNNCFTPLPLVKLLKEFVDLSVLDFSWNDWITNIPDVSSAPNLKELCFACCENLVKIDESVGVLGKLTVLEAHGCTKLRSLPSLKLPSLSRLTLANCYSLETFPEILGKMENITYLDLYETSISELPNSICNLTRLYELNLRDGGTIVLPSSIFMLGELEKLEFLRCKDLLLSDEEGVEQVSTASLSTATYLDLSSCNLSDKFFGIFLARFPNVQELNLSGCNFTILPACIENCQALRFLYLPDCKNLQEIRGIPPNIQSLDAAGTTSLSCSSRGLLLNEKLHEEVGKKKFILPGTSIPSWFEHQSSGQPISFWFRNQFPAMSLCFLFKDQADDKCSISPHLKLVPSSGDQNGWHIFRDQVDTYRKSHIHIYDLQDNGGQQFQQNEWNQALVSLSRDYGESQLSPEEWGNIEIGVHIIKERSSMSDIKFTDPLLTKEDHIPLGMAMDMGDSHTHHISEQQSGVLEFSFELSLPSPPPLSDNLLWGPLRAFPGRGYFAPNASRFQYLKSDSLNANITEKAPGESSNITCCGEAREEELHPISTCVSAWSTSTNNYLSNENEVMSDDDDDDVEIDAFYASLGVASIPMLSRSHEKLFTATPSDEETRKAFKYVQDFLSNDASVLLYPELCSILKANLDYLSKLSADNGSISTEMSKVISEASQFLTHWSRDYSEAHTKIDSIMSQLQRADELEMSLESNKKRYLEIVASRKRKREVFEEGKTIKTELDELRKNVPQWEHEHTLAKKTQATIIAEWSRLRETFQNIEKEWNL
ncbi:hypothetical protein PIB30_019030 [Stylosanthes scabra]|uniref:TIR domain-containing protein n=1 Tax=Stylosanthes scabra TaxID=79078 RepID=A0ABU6R8J7_9FABA|nr:hypothetical protein [Stylosanthes scabra]